MNVYVRGKNIELTPALKDYVEKRIGKLEKYFDGFGDAQVTLVVEKDLHRVEVTIPIKANGFILRGEEASDDMYASTDLVFEKLEKQISKYKGKMNEKRSRANGEKSPAAQMITKEAAEKIEGPSLVKTKRFAIKPMSVEEAVLQMNLLGHTFFVFSNAETDQVNVVYMRKDGNFGLIEPEFK